MMKKIILITILLTFMIGTNTLAFEMVEEEESKAYSGGIELGIAVNDESSTYIGLVGNYDFNNKISLQGILGQVTKEGEGSSDDETELLTLVKGLYRFTSDLDSSMYLFSGLGNIDDDISLSAGLGLEKTNEYFTFLKNKYEIGYTTNGSVLLSYNINVSF